MANKVSYSSLIPTTEMGAMCYPCEEYKGMVDCPECAATFCVFCADGCPDCLVEIDFTYVP